MKAGQKLAGIWFLVYGTSAILAEPESGNAAMAGGRHRCDHGNRDAHTSGARTNRRNRPFGENALMTRQLGTTGLNISAIGFGAWEIGGDRNWTGPSTPRAQHIGPSDDREAAAAIHRALELGVNWIDTAPGYGAGHSEELIGKVIHDLSERPYIFTKCGFVWDEERKISNNIRPKSIRSEVEQSLRRLGVDVIDLYQIHWVEPQLDPQVEAAWSTLADLKREGKVRHIGVSNFSIDQLRRAGTIAPVETLQPRYSLLDRTIEHQLLPYCDEFGIGVLVYSPMQSGLLTGAMTRERVLSFPPNDGRRFDVNYQEPRLSSNLERIQQLSRLASEWGWSAGQVAVAWALSRKEVHGAIVGFRRPAQVEGILMNAPVTLDPDQLAAIEAINWSDSA
jgi:aryl-alcohol dehydrogenase-like predicted oxidoreductase